MWWRIALLVLAYLLLGAHFLRFGDTLWAILLAATPLILFTRKVLSLRLLQAGLIIGTCLVWAPTTYQLISMRMMFDQPWTRMAVILGTVMLCNLLIAYAAEGLKEKLL